MFIPYYTVAQLQMIMRINSYSQDPSRVSITNSVAALEAAFALLNTKQSNCTSLFDQYHAVITGITNLRRQSRLDLANFSYTIMKSVYAFATQPSSPNPTLAAKVKFNLSSLQRMAFVKLATTIANAITATDAVVASLSSYNITAATITDWQTQLAAYNGVLNLPTEAIKQRKSTGAEYSQAITDAMNLVRNQIDGLVARLMQTQSAYYIGYRSQRELTDTAAKRHTRADVLVIDELSKPFIYAKVTVDAFTDPETGNSYKAVSGITDENGFVSVKAFFPGIRTITISGNGVKSKTFGPYNFQKGKAVLATCICAPSFENIPAPQSQPQTAKVSK